MIHPWQQIPLSDYEQHMALPTVGQAQMLSGELAAAVCAHGPQSVAVIGCAGGNGFEGLAPPVERVVGIDINPNFIEAARARYATRIPGLELHVADIEAQHLAVAPVDLIFAGLIFEYVDVSKALKALHDLCNGGGVLVAVLQLVSPTLTAVSPSPYKSLRTLGDAMQLHDPSVLEQVGSSSGFTHQATRLLTLQSGKKFAVLTFRRKRHHGEGISTST